MNKLDAIQLQKRQIECEKEELEYTKRDFQQTEENYEAFFHRQKELLNGLQEEFDHSQTNMVYKNVVHEIHRQSRGIQKILHDHQHELKQQVNRLEDRQNELDWQERRIAVEEKDGNNEH